MTKLSCGLLAAIFLADTAGAQSMPLHRFVERGNKLESLGPLALLQQDEIGALKTELTGAVGKLRQERLAAQKSKRRQAFCPPEGSGLKLEPVGLLRELRTISASQPKAATTTDGMRIYLARKYPCTA